MKLAKWFSIGAISLFTWQTAQADELIFPQESSENSYKAMNAEDPYEDYNRKAFAFNMAFHDAIGEPVSDAYLTYTPDPVQIALGNFFDNLATPLDALNNLLQGDVEQSMEGIMRFVMNSTFGLAGLIDVATPAGIPDHPEDFGQTLYKWGLWNESSFVVVPFLGPYTTRSLLGKVGDSNWDPIYEMDEGRLNRTVLFTGDALVTYAKASPLIAEMRVQPDPYIFMRESYLQYRINQIHDGNPPQANLDDFDFE